MTWGLLTKRNLEKVLSEKSREDVRRQEFLLRILINFEQPQPGRKGKYDQSFIFASVYVMQKMRFIPKIWTDFDNRTDITDSILHEIDLEELERRGFVIPLTEGYILNKAVLDEYFRENLGQTNKFPPKFVEILKIAETENVLRLAQILRYSEMSNTPQGINFQKLKGAKRSYGISNEEYQRAVSLYRELKKLDSRRQILL